MRTLTLTLATALTLGLTACAGDDGNDTDVNGDTDGDTDGDSDTGPPPTPVLAGTVSNEGGDPVEGATILLCNADICFPAVTDAAGAYAFNFGDGDFAFKVQAAGYPTASTALTTAEDGTTRTLDVTLPDFDKTLSMPTTSAEHELATDFFVTFSGSDLEIPDTSDATVAGGTFVEESLRMPMDEVPSDGTLVGLWYLDAYDGEAKGEPMPFRIANVGDLGLSDGDTVEVHYHSYKWFTTPDNNAETQWLQAGPATVANGELTGTIPKLATIAVYKK